MKTIATLGETVILAGGELGSIVATVVRVYERGTVVDLLTWEPGQELFSTLYHVPVAGRLYDCGNDRYDAEGNLIPYGLPCADDGADDVRGNRHGADASQPGPAHPPGDSRHLEGGG